MADILVCTIVLSLSLCFAKIRSNLKIQFSIIFFLIHFLDCVRKMVICSAYGCSNSSKSKVKQLGVTFHSFPRNLERRAQWTRAMRRGEWSPPSYAKICSVHFKEEDLDRTSLSCVRVREHAAPSIFPAFLLHTQSKEKICRALPTKRKLSLAPPTLEHEKRVSELVPSTSKEQVNTEKQVEINSQP